MYDKLRRAGGALTMLMLLVNSCALIKGYNVDSGMIQSLEVELVHSDDVSIPNNNRIITNKDSILTIIKKHINTSHKASIFKGRLKYRIGVHYYGLQDVVWIGVTDKYIKYGEDWYKMRKNLSVYLDGTR